MENKTKMPYGIALDIGVGSIGWAAIDVHSRLLHLQGKTGNGVRLFDEGRTAADRRFQRSARRNHRREKKRLRELDCIFAPYIRRIDPGFFERRKYAGRKHCTKYSNQLFDNVSDRDFRKEYPTDYHLRKALMDHPEHKFDIRGIYLALHHIVKSRGNFLMNGSARDFSVDQIDWKKELTSLTDHLRAFYPELDIELDPTYLADIQTAFLAQGIVARTAKESPVDDKGSKFIETQRRLYRGYPDLVERLHQSSLYDIESLTKTGSLIPNMARHMTYSSGQAVQSILKDLIRAILGKKFTVNNLFPVPEGSSTIKVDIESWDDHISEISSLLEGIDGVDTFIGTIKRLHATIVLKRILSDSHSISEHMVQVYQNKIARDRGDTNAVRLDTTQQRSKDNHVLPYQLHQSEMDAIIANQGQYYPFLKEPNPVPERRKDFPYKLDELVGFRIPYYVGPLVSHDQSPFAWMVRKDEKDDRAITPWNFYDQIDWVATSQAFMERLRTTDNILLGEPVLAKNTLLYQDYCVLNELNKIKIRDWDTGTVHRLTVTEKQGIYRTCFRAKKHVQAQDVLRYIRAHPLNERYRTARLEVLGLSDKESFNNGLTTYRDLYRIYGDELDDWLQDTQYRREFDHVLELASTFPNSEIFLAKLERLPYPFLDGKRERWSHQLYQGWGRLSARLLTGTTDKEGETVMDLLWRTNHNFMQIIHRDDLRTSIEDHNQAHIQHHGVRRTVHDMYTSPQNKRAILQSILVIRDIAKARGQAPDWVFLETARDARTSSYRPKSRLTHLKRLAKYLDTDVKKELQSLGKGDPLSERQLLYFQQNGRDIYDHQKRLDWDHLSEYDIDHVLPRSLIKDDSLDNRVLTTQHTNAMKGNTQFAKDVSDASTIRGWGRLLASGLLSNRKYDNLMLTEAGFDRRINEFTARQLVETRQIIKLVAQMVAFEYPRTEVINVKSELSSDFRRTFHFPKDRDVNDYHHAFDAYLAGMIGNFFRRRSSYWHRFVSNDDYNKQLRSSSSRGRAARLSDKQSLNFIYQMDHAQYRDRNHSPILYDEGHRHIIWNKQRDLNYLRSVYDNPDVLITHRTYERYDSLFEETRIPAQKATARTIPLKDGLAPREYGGYHSIHFAYYILVRVERAHQKGTTVKTKILSIPTKLDIRMGQAPTARQQHQLLMSYVRHQLMSPKDYEKGLTERYRFRVLRDARGRVRHLPYEQSLEYRNSEGTHYTRRISGNWRDGAQLYMPLKMQRTLNSSHITPSELDRIFDYVCDEMNNNFPGFNRTQIDKLTQHREKFYDISQIGTKQQVLGMIFRSIHSDGESTPFHKINGMSGYFGKMGFQTAETLSPLPRYILYQSPTGLFTRRSPIHFDNN